MPLSASQRFTALTRLTGRLAGRNRYVRATYAASEATAGSVKRAARNLWLEVTGFLFFAIAVVLAAAAWREYVKYSAHQIGLAKPVAAALFAALFFWFGLSSFWRARR